MIYSAFAFQPGFSRQDIVKTQEPSPCLLLPDGNSALMLVCARLRYVAGSQWGNKKYLNMKHLENIDLALNPIAG
jgi:hypothetical protein